MKNLKCLVAAIGITVMAFGMTGCATVPADQAIKSAVPTVDLHCTLPTNCISSQGGTGIAPLAFTGTNAEALAQLRTTLRSFPEATVLAMTETKLIAIFTTPAGFKDTVEFGIDSTAHRIDFRSQSNFGLFDFGKNHSRMTEFAKRFMH